MYSLHMRIVQLIQSVKMDSPFVIVGDPPAQIALTEAAADFAVQQGLATETGLHLAYETEPLIPEAGVSPVLPEEPVRHVKEEAPEREPVSQPDPETPPQRPDGRKGQKVWAEYAAAVDPELSLERALGMSKNELLSRYGQRL